MSYMYVLYLVFKIVSLFLEGIDKDCVVLVIQSLQLFVVLED